MTKVNPEKYIFYRDGDDAPAMVGKTAVPLDNGNFMIFCMLKKIFDSLEKARRNNNG